MKFIIFILLTTITSNSFAQFDGFNLFNPKPEAPTKPSYKLIQPPKDKKLGNFKLSCTNSAGEQIPELTNIQIRQVRLELSNYILTKMDGKTLYVPINFCIIIEN